MRIEEYTLAELKEAQLEQAGRVAERKTHVDQARENLLVMQRRLEQLRQADSVDFQRLQETQPHDDVEDVALILSRRNARDLLVNKAKFEIEILEQRLAEASRRHEREVALLENIVAEIHFREREQRRFDEQLEYQQLRDQARLNVAARATAQAS